MMARDRTMRLGNLAMVTRIADARGQLLHQLAVLRGWTPGDGGLMLDSARPYVITLQGARLDAAMLALVRPAIETELMARVAEAERDLAALGVIVERRDGEANPLTR